MHGLSDGAEEGENDVTDPFDLLARSVYYNTKELAVRYAKVPGIRIFVKADRCTGCSKCVRDGFCRFGAICVAERKAVIDERRCRACMRCTHLCPRNALAIEVVPPKVVQDTLREVDNEIDRRLKKK